jgi:hypothetical protein
MFAKLSAIATIVASLLGGATQVAPVEAKMAVEQVVNSNWADNPIYRTMWLADTLEEAGVVVPANVEIEITDEENCGSEISPELTGGGCTIYPVAKGDVTRVLVSPTALEDGTGAHILFHELGHALYQLDECAAEYFSHNYSDADQWSYPECNV